MKTSVCAVTIARAIELKHSTSIISSLAYETARMFQAAGTVYMYYSSHTK